MEYSNIAIAAVAILLAVILYYQKVRYTYWKRRGVPYIEPEFFYGNVKKSIKRLSFFGEEFLQFYRDFKKRGDRFVGIYILFKPVLLVIDPELIKCILQKDFDHFVNRGIYSNEKVDPLSGHLVNLEDTKWRNLRSKLTPTFTSGKMKMMFETLVECSEELDKILEEHTVIEDAVDIKEELARFTTDVIGSCAFGLEFNSLKNPDSEFRNIGRKLFTPSIRTVVGRLIATLFPREFLRAIGFKQSRKEYESFFMNLVQDIVDYREKNNVFRKDFMHLLLQLKNRGEVSNDEAISNGKVDAAKQQGTITMNEIAAQCFVFFLAGFETSSTTMTFALLELALNQDIQDKLRKEIRSVLKKYDNKLTYEAVMEMTYLDKVVNEALRKHPPVRMLPRVCNKDYPIPGTDVVIEKGTRVQIPIYGLHTDPEYYPEPEVFDPERFNEENKAKRPSFTFIPFGDGPRICIGLRFGLMQSKVGLIKTVGNYRVTLNEKTKTPIVIDPRSSLATVEGGVWLNISKVED